MRMHMTFYHAYAFRSIMLSSGAPCGIWSMVTFCNSAQAIRYGHTTMATKKVPLPTRRHCFGVMVKKGTAKRAFVIQQVYHDN